MLSMSAQRPKARIHRLSRSIVSVLVIGSIAAFAFTPETPLGWAAEIAFRSWLMFLGGVMAHEATHGHLGTTRRSNDWWGRLALFPAMVPYLCFRKTHPMHHAHTNVPEDDPDYFVKPRHWLEVPLRSTAIPHYWVLWLERRNKLTRRDVVELVLHYLAMGAIFGTLMLIVGGARFWLSMGPSLVIVSTLLWYPFGVMTHEGFSTGAEEERTHNYYGHFAFWLSLGLSMHREHHLKPRLAWIELLPYVQPAPGRGLRLFQRDVRRLERVEQGARP
jgi:fatty acid desaturase